jgi:hypothetical protein
MSPRMSSPKGVPGRPRNGSWATPAWLPHEALCAAALVSCLNGNAEPIVRLPGAAGTDGGAVGPLGTPGDGGLTCDLSGPLVLYYDNAQTAANANGIDFLFKVANVAGATLSLSSLAIRYYFTNEIAPPWETSVFYAGTCCKSSRAGFNADVNVSVVSMPPTPTADHFLEMTFAAAAGVLLDGDSVQVEVGFHAPGFGQNLNQANDYSFIATATGTQAEWDLCPTQCALFHSCLMTVYKDGALVWGTPP